MVGDTVGEDVMVFVGPVVTGASVGDGVTGEDEHLVAERDRIVGPTTDDQPEVKSCSATQKNAPPLHGYVFARSVIT